MWHVPALLWAICGPVPLSTHFSWLTLTSVVETSIKHTWVIAPFGCSLIIVGNKFKNIFFRLSNIRIWTWLEVLPCWHLSVTGFFCAFPLWSIYFLSWVYCELCTQRHLITFSGKCRLCGGELSESISMSVSTVDVNSDLLIDLYIKQVNRVVFSYFEIIGWLKMHAWTFNRSARSLFRFVPIPKLVTLYFKGRVIRYYMYLLQ